MLWETPPIKHVYRDLYRKRLSAAKPQFNKARIICWHSGSGCEMVPPSRAGEPSGMFRRWAIAGAVLALAARLDVVLSAQIVTPDAEPRSLTLSDGVLAMKQGSDFIAFEILARYAQLGYRVAEANLAGLYMSGRGTP